MLMMQTYLYILIDIHVEPGTNRREEEGVHRKQTVRETDGEGEKQPNSNRQTLHNIMKLCHRLHGGSFSALIKSHLREKCCLVF